MEAITGLWTKVVRVGQAKMYDGKLASVFVEIVCETKTRGEETRVCLSFHGAAGPISLTRADAVGYWNVARSGR